MSNRFHNPRPQFFTSTPTVYASGTLTFHASGTSTPLDTYSDVTLATANTNPIVLNSAGRPNVDIFLSDAAYKVILKDSTGATIWTADPVSTSDFSANAQIRTFAGNPNGNVAGTAGTPGTIPADLIWDNTNSTLYVCTTTGTAGTAVWTAYNPSASSTTPFVAPGGRLTLTTAEPVLTADVTAATTIFYTPYIHGYVWLYNGTSWVASPFTETSQTLADTTKSPAATSADSNYDLFVWNDSAVIRCTRGPAWTGDTARGTGAGTTELERVNGAYVNKITITNGPAAQRGLYVGTIRTNGSNQVDYMVLPAAAAGGSANKIYVWNMFNRVVVSSACRDSTNSWTYSTATLRAADGSNSNRISFIVGLNEDTVEASYSGYTSHGSAAVTNRVGVGLDSTSAIAAGSYPAIHLLDTIGLVYPIGPALFGGLPGLGHHFVQALEYAQAAATSTWYGDNGSPTLFQMVLNMKWRA